MTVGYDPSAQTRKTGGLWLLLLVVLMAAGGGAWWFLRDRGGAVSTEDALAAAAPADAQVYASLDARDQTSAPRLLAKLRELGKQFPDLAKSIEQAEKEAGVTLDEVAKWMQPAGFLAVLPREGQKSLLPSEPGGPRSAEVLIALPVTDEDAARKTVEALLKSAKTPARQEDQEGVKCWVSGPPENEVAIAVAHKYLWIGSGAGTLARGLKTLAGKAPSLAAQPQFLEARKRLGARSGLFSYVAVRDMLAPLPKVPGVASHVDEQTMQAIQALPYVAGYVDIGSGASAFFLKVDAASQSGLVKALLTPKTVTPAMARFFPSTWANFSSLNASYVGHVAVELIRLFPESREQAGKAVVLATLYLGFDPFADFLKMSDGDVAWSSDFVKAMPSVMTGSFEQARGRGQVMACASNLKNIGTACEMYSTDNSGRFPTSLAQLTPNYLRSIPSCPAAGSDTYSATFKSGSGPDRFEVACGGRHHADSGAADNRPLYTSDRGLEGMPTTAAARPPEPRVTGVVAISVKDAQAATDLIGKLEKKLRLTSRVVKNVAGVDIRGYDAQPVRWTLVTQPLPALLIAGGPDADARLEEALTTSSQAASSVEAVADYQALTREAQSRLVATTWLDLGPLIDAGSQMLDASKDVPEAARTWLKEQLKSRSGALASTSVTAVEADGIIMRSRGFASPTAVVGIAAAVLVPNFIRARAQGQEPQR